MLFSIVIPTYNRLPILRKCLAALEAQQGMEPGDQFEIVLVDDGSTDETVPWLHANKALLPHLRLVCQDHGGPALGRNLGVAEAKGEVIVFIDEMHTLVGAGAGDGSMDASNMLKPALARGELHCIGATTLAEYRKYVEKDAALTRRFQPVFVTQPSVEDTISILRGLKEKYEMHHGVHISDNALVSAAVLSNRYITDRFLPDKAIDLMDEASSKLRMEIDSKPENIDEIDRKAIQLKIEREALKKEEDSLSKIRLKELDEKIAELDKKSASLTEVWAKEKNQIQSVQKIKEEKKRWV